MTQITSVRLDDLTDGEPFEMPGGSEPVLLHRLLAETSRAFSVFVRFPAGWTRPVTGHYVAAEDVLFLSGLLTIGDETFGPGDWAHIPATFSRRTMHTRTGALAIARFDGPARWVDGSGGVSRGLIRRNVAQMHGTESTPFGSGQLLRVGEADSSWLISAPSATDAASPMEAQIVDLATYTWYHVPAGSPVPALAGSAFCWTVEA